MERSDSRLGRIGSHATRHSNLVAFLLLVAMPFVTSSFLLLLARHLFLEAMQGQEPLIVFLLRVAMPFAPSSKGRFLKFPL